jgi:hypothetical protein
VVEVEEEGLLGGTGGAEEMRIGEAGGGSIVTGDRVKARVETREGMVS